MKKLINYLKSAFIFLGILLTFKNSAQCTASFNYSVGNNGSVTFTSTSVGTNSASTFYSWNLGNSTFTTGVNLISPTVTYTANGSYTVVMTFSNPCVSSASAVVTVTNIAGCFLNVGMNYSQGSNGVIFFNNTSTGIVSGTTYTLDFGDSSPSSNNFTSHTYSANGIYTATLTADNNSTPTCTSSNVFNVNVTSYCGFTSSFSYSLNLNGLVSFTSTSTGTNTSNFYVWNFGDGSQSISGTNLATCSHTYSNGTFIVMLSITNNSFAPTCTVMSQQSITVNSNTCNIIAGYTYTLGPNGLVSYNNTSTGTINGTSYNWNFGDGTVSGINSPSHTYSSAGVYTVSVTAINGSTACANSFSQTINVTSANCTANAGFSVAPTSTALVWNATPSYPWNVLAAIWNWGDGSSSWGLYTSHTYSASGTYSICLTLTVSCGGVATSCSSYFIFKSLPSSQMVQINVVQPALVSVYIESVSTMPLAFDVFPNPNNGEFQLNLSENSAQPVTIKLYSLTGAELFEEQFGPEEHEARIKTGGLVNGIYILQLKNNDKVAYKKITIAD